MRNIYFLLQINMNFYFSIKFIEQKLHISRTISPSLLKNSLNIFMLYVLLLVIKFYLQYRSNYSKDKNSVINITGKQKKKKIVCTSDQTHPISKR